MHTTAINTAQFFFTTYATSSSRIVDIGAQDVNGSLKNVIPVGAEYIGVDFAAGKNVDVVLTNPYKYPLDDNYADIVVSSSCFEHSEMFWLSFIECMRILKPGGLFYLNVPSNGMFHRYPVDCWRFYPDSGKALVTWGKHSGYNCALLESFVTLQYYEFWSDFVAVIIKDEQYINNYPKRILHKLHHFLNGRIGDGPLMNEKMFPEDQWAKWGNR